MAHYNERENSLETISLLHPVIKSRFGQEKEMAFLLKKWFGQQKKMALC